MKSNMLAILGLTNKMGYKIEVNFKLNPDALIDRQVRAIIANFSICESAILTMRSNEGLPIIRYYIQRPNLRNYLVRCRQSDMT